MLILGIGDSHDAHACIVRDGELVAVIAEERLSRLKSDGRYPRRAIEAVLHVAGVDASEIDVVAFASKSDWIWQTLYNRQARFSIANWIDEMDTYWRPRLLEGKNMDPLFLFDHFRHIDGPDLNNNPYLPMIDLIRGRPMEEWGAIGDAIRRETIRAHLGILGEKVRFFRHEDCHKSYGYHSSPFVGERSLVFTLEGGGDDSSATLSIAEKGGAIREIWKSNRVHLGRAYCFTTLLLGMNPAQHEYKVMGLAPYGTEYHGRRSLEFFRTINRVEGSQIVNDEKVPDLYFTVGHALRSERFDGIAWGLQVWLEETISQWVANACREFGSDSVILSGGVAQNIKVCKVLTELPEVRQFWAGPISGDGSLCIGAAWLASRALAPQVPIKGLPGVYLGTAHGPKAVDAAVEALKLRDRFQIIDKPSTAAVAGWLDQGRIVARFSGRMEFGQRALGNRSILADPRRWDSVERVNRQIKYRDFWMPFTPSMTERQAKKMIENPKGADWSYMTIAFDLKKEFRTAIPAAIHPADKTVRPQALKRDVNLGYYDLIEAFGNCTGLEVLMNTSFNLHGDAIVESPEQAIHTFLKSEIDVLLFDEVAVSRVNLDEKVA